MNPSSPTANDLSSLYKQDYFLWLEATVRLLQLGKLSQLDVDNLLEELEDMGRSEKRAIYSNLKILLLHLLKYRYQPEKRSNSWTGTIVEHRQRLNRALQESPSLRPYLTEIFSECYRDARELAVAETGLEIEQFPLESPFTIPTILSSDCGLD
jgi:hypothetical protein